MYHVGRPGEDGFTERVLAAWGVDGHNSHTNICSSGGRAGYHWWMGLDRPSPDHANADVILLISAHLESGHYFNPHAQRIVEARERGAKLIVLDTRLSNTATKADHWLAPVPGSEAAMLLAFASHLIRTGRHDRDYVRRWWNWQEYLAHEHADGPQTFEEFERVLAELYAEYTFEFAERESGIDAAVLREVADVIAAAGTKLASHVWRSASAGNLGGWQVARTLFLLNALLGAVAVEGGTYPNAWNKFVPKPMYLPGHPPQWNELTWPEQYPLAMNEMSFLLPQLLKEGRGPLDVYFTRVYNPVWTNPDGFAWIEALGDETLVGLHVALTPTWSETAFLADYVLPMGHGSERHDIHSYEQYDGQWVGFRQPVLRAARERLGETIRDTREVNPGEVWEENELWIDLSWRIDPDGVARHPRASSSRRSGPARSSASTSTTPGSSSTPCPACPSGQRRRGSRRSRGCGATARSRSRAASGHCTSSRCPRRSSTTSPSARTAASTRARPSPTPRTSCPCRRPSPTSDGRRPVGVEVDGAVLRGWPTPSGRLEFYSRTLAEWGWPEAAVPTYLRSHVHPDALEAGQIGPDLDLPAAGADPHPLGECEVARRDRPHEPALAAPARRRSGSAARAPASSCASRPRSATSSSRPG